jgi:hypothetical protein
MQPHQHISNQVKSPYSGCTTTTTTTTTTIIIIIITANRPDIVLLDTKRRLGY